MTNKWLKNTRDVAKNWLYMPQH